MSAALTPADVLGGIAGWQGARVTEIHGGLTNRTWLVEQNGRKGVLKIDSAPRSEPFNTRQAEARVQGMAAANGLANAVLYADEQVLLSAFAEGEVWSADHLRHADNIERLANALRGVHSLPLTGRSFDARVAARRYAAQVDDAGRTMAWRCNEIVDSMRLPHNLCCCHNDLVAENIIAVPEIRLLDWEYACDNDPLFDLATLVEHYGLSDALAGCLLDAYFDGNGRAWLAQLREQQRLYRALLWLWLASRPETRAAERDAVAARIDD